MFSRVGSASGPRGAGVAAPKFTFNHLKELEKKAKSITTVMAYTENSAAMKYKGRTHAAQVTGVGPQYPQVRSQKTTLGSFFSASQYQAGKKVVVLGKTVYEELFKEENPIG